VLNDDNNGQYPGFASSLQNQVISNQAVPSIAVNAQGEITVIWYDTRNDPSGTDIAVWGTTSTDGGKSFSPNFEVSNTSFNPNHGAVADLNGVTYLGDQIGVAVSNGTAYAVWTDTRSGTQQQVFSGSYALAPAPQPGADRFSPNNTPQTATNLGTVTAQRVVPLLTLPAGGADEFFNVQAGANGELSVTVTAASGGSSLHLTITDAHGNAVPGAVVSSVLDATGAVIGQVLVAPSVAGQTFLIHVSAQSATATSYTLTLGALTADLGTQVQGSRPDKVTAGGENLYRLEVPLAGALQVNVTGSSVHGTGLNVKVLGSDGQTVLATAFAPISSTDPSAQVLLPVTTGQVVFVEVAAADAGSSGNFTLGFTNFDQFQSSSAAATGSVTVTGAPATNVDLPLTAEVNGTLNVTVNASGGFTGALKVRVLNGTATALLAGSDFVQTGQSAVLSLQVTAGQTVIVRVSGVTFGGVPFSGTANYTLGLQNQSQGTTTLFFPTQGTPSSLAAADLTGTGQVDFISSNVTTSDTVSVLANNGDGTFQAPQQLTVDPGLSGFGGAVSRQLVVAHLGHNGTGPADVIVPNARAGDVSVLMGNGNGTFQPQRIFNAIPGVDVLATADLNGDGNADIIALQNFAQGAPASFAVLLGRGDGTFLPPTFVRTVFTNGAGPMVVGDFNGDGKQDVVIFSKNDPFAEMFLGNGDGTFKPGFTFGLGENTFNAAVADLNGDGKLDLVTTGTNTGNVYVMLGNGNGTFGAPQAFTALAPHGTNISVQGLVLTDFGNGAPGGPLNIVVTAQPRGAGAAQVIELPGDGTGAFGTPVVLATVGTAGPVVAGDFLHNGTTDLAIGDTGGVTVIYGSPLTITPNNSAAAARIVGGNAHIVTLPQAIVTGHQDAFFTYHVPVESAAGSGPEVIDFSALFQFTGGTGLQMQVTDVTTGQVLGTGARFRAVANQGDVLTIHIFGLPASGSTPAGFGAYTLDIDVLPQVVGIAAESPLPGAAANSLVITLQGDQLDPVAAQNPANYTVTWAGPDGKIGTADDQVIPVAATAGAQPVVYDSAANVNIESGLTYVTATRQTITLLFTTPLPAGTYQVSLSPKIQTAQFNAGEPSLLVGSGFGGHPIVSANGNVVTNGNTTLATNLVNPPGTINPDAIVMGTDFLSQLDNDLGALLYSQLQQNGDTSAITAIINAEIAARFAAVGSGVTIGVVWLDPVSLNLAAPRENRRTEYNLKTEQVTDTLSRTYVAVGGNVEVVVLAGVSGTFKLDVSDVPLTARGGAVIFDADGRHTLAFTDAMRTGTTEFLINIAEATSGLSSTVFSSLGGTTTATIDGDLARELLASLRGRSAGGLEGAEANGSALATSGGTIIEANGGGGAAPGGPGDDDLTLFGAGGGISGLRYAVDELFLRMHGAGDVPALDPMQFLARATLRGIEFGATELNLLLNALAGENHGALPAADVHGEALARMPEAAEPEPFVLDGWMGADLAPKSEPDAICAVLGADQPSRADAYWLALFLASGAGHAALRDSAASLRVSREKSRRGNRFDNDLGLP
jgi:hypothetical protein